MMAPAVKMPAFSRDFEKMIKSRSERTANTRVGDLAALEVSLVVVVSGYDVVAAQIVHARKSYDYRDIRFGRRYADILDITDEGRLRIDYGRFHETLEV